MSYSSFLYVLYDDETQYTHIHTYAHIHTYHTAYMYVFMRTYLWYIFTYIYIRTVYSESYSLLIKLFYSTDNNMYIVFHESKFVENYSLQNIAVSSIGRRLVGEVTFLDVTQHI